MSNIKIHPLYCFSSWISYLFLAFNRVAHGLKIQKEENKSWSYNAWFLVKKHVLPLVST